ncbi:hypothetical protein WN943_019685 [Citrus x changshan-huyou]
MNCEWLIYLSLVSELIILQLLVDNIGEATITNDGATILKMLEVEHPAAKVLVELAELQNREAGDGTTSVAIGSAEFLKEIYDIGEYADLAIYDPTVHFAEGK